MFCKECGKEIDENSKFCSICGAKLPEKAKTKRVVTEQPKEERVKHVVAEKAKKVTVRTEVADQSGLEGFSPFHGFSSILSMFNKPAPTYSKSMPISGYKVTDACVNCGSCEMECTVNAISEKNGKRYIDPDKCVDCKECPSICPTEAIVQRLWGDVITD